MLFLGIISWKGASRFNGEGGGGVFQMGGGLIFKWGVRPTGRGIRFGGRALKKIKG